MEKWQMEHITKNMTELVTMTTFNCIIKSELVAKNILCQADVKKLDAVEKQQGELEASRHYYDMLLTRKGAYLVLYSVLVECNQSGAARILIRVPNELFSKPLKYLGISTTLNGTQNVQIEANGKVFKLQDFFPAADKNLLQRIFRESISDVEFYDCFIIKEKTFILSKSTIPPKPSFYIPRHLSNRLQLNIPIFKSKCSDVFVFRNTIPRYKLSQIAKPNFTNTSTSQLTKITSRFIYLEENEHWNDLKTLTTLPIHLMNYEENKELFILEDSSAASEILAKLGSQNERIYNSEPEFVRQKFCGNSRNQIVCICDTPGMGKTFLLANIARLMTECSAGKLIVFLPLPIFTKEFSVPSTNNTPEVETSILNILRYISTCEQTTNLLLQLLKAELIHLEIFFDGFDEIPSNTVQEMKHVFKTITSEYSQINIYIASRPHMRQELEESLGVLAYDILPFNEQNQIDFMVKFWSLKLPNCEKKLIKTYAKQCLEAVNKSLLTTDQQITGIPLLCQLIAEVYSNKLSISLISKPFIIVPMTIPNMYEKFIELRINFVASNQQEFDNYELVHTFHALKLLFPEEKFHQDNQFNAVKHLLESSQIFKIGIVQQQSSQSTMEFIHRTFAEFLCAEYFTKYLRNTQTPNIDVVPILKIFLPIEVHTRESKAGYSNSLLIHDFRINRSVITYFMDSMLAQSEICENVKIQLASFIYSLPPGVLTFILCALIQSNFSSIFTIFKEGLINLDGKLIHKYLPPENCLEILLVCVRMPSGQMFHSCINFFTKVFENNVIKTALFDNLLITTAVQYGNYEVLEYFMVEGISLKGLNILEECVSNSYYESDIRTRDEMLHLLLVTDPSLISENRIILECFEIHLQLIKTFVKFGASPISLLNLTEKTASYMCPIDYHNLVKFLLTDCKAEFQIKNNLDCWNVLENIMSMISLLPETLELLISIPGIDINIKDTNVENLLFSAARGNQVENFKELVKLQGLDLNVRGLNNRNLLHVAAAFRAEDMVRYLLSLKLEPNSCDNDGETPLHKVANSRCITELKILVESGANVQAKNLKGCTILHLYANSGGRLVAWKEVLEYLIEKGLDINDTDNDGNTALHLCNEREDVECLIELGADIHIRNKMGQTAAQKTPELWQSSQSANKSCVLT